MFAWIAWSWMSALRRHHGAMSRVDMRVRGLKDLAASSRRLVTEVKHLEGRYGGRPAAGSRAAVEANDTALGNPLWGERPIEASDLHVVCGRSRNSPGVTIT